jgi:hypothetical protein
MPRTIKKEGGGKRYPLNMRTTKETRDRLEAAADVSGRSLVQEVEARLERSFHQEAVLGSPAMARQAFLMAASFANATHTKDWTTDPIAYADGVASVLDALLRDIPEGPDKGLAIGAIVSRLMTRLAQEREQANG